MRRTIAKSITRTLPGQWGDAKISFLRVDRPDTGIIMSANNSRRQIVSLRNVTVGFRNIQLNCATGPIRVIEHILAAVLLKGITDLEIVLQAQWNVFPSLTEPTQPFIDMIDEVGIHDFKHSQLMYKVVSADMYSLGDRSITILPHDDLIIEYIIDFPGLVKDSIVFNATKDDPSQVAQARPLSAIKFPVKIPNILIGGFSERFLIAQNGMYRCVPRFDGKEAVLHKVDDFLGALGCFGRNVRGYFRNVRGGHGVDIAALNYFVQKGSIELIKIQ